MISLLERVNLILSESTGCVAPHPVHYRFIPPFTVSEAFLIRDLEPSNKNLNEISKKLNEARPKITNRESGHIKSYTGKDPSSLSINESLIEAHNTRQPPNMSSEDEKVHRSILRLSSNPIGHSVDLYSGVGFDPKKLLGAAGSTLYLPAHTSATHSPLVALQHAIQNRPRTGPMGMGKTAHMIKITTTPTTKGFHVGDLSSYKNEQETVLPAGTTLKYSHTTMHNVQENPQFPVKVRLHHFTVQSQK